MRVAPTMKVMGKRKARSELSNEYTVVAHPSSLNNRPNNKISVCLARRRSYQPRGPKVTIFKYKQVKTKMIYWRNKEMDVRSKAPE